MSKKKFSLKEYSLLVKEGKRLINRDLVIFYKESNKTIIKVSAKKKVGKAFKRNYFKRVLRDILNKITYKQSYFVLVICRNPISLGYFDFKKKIRVFVRELLY